jgi:enoyl-CoA hydratase
MESPQLLVEKSDGIATLTLNRPDAMNALSAELRAALVDTFQALRVDGETRVVILTGAGRAFCAGLDLKEMSRGEGSDRIFGAGHDPVLAMAEFEGPIIGAINGHAITGGFELALACDLMIASGNAVFADTHVRVGIMPGWGLSQKLSRIVGISRAKEISLTGNFVTASQALAWGLVNHVVPSDELMRDCRKLAQEMVDCDPKMLRGYKRLMDEGYSMNFGDAMVHESRIAKESMRQVSASDVAGRRDAVQERGRTQDQG